MKFKEFLARRSTTTTHSMNPEYMSDEYNIMNRRRSFGRGGAGNIRSREEAVTLLPISMSMSSMIHGSQHHQHHHLDHELGSGSKKSASASASNSDDTKTSRRSSSEDDDAVYRHDSQRHPISPKSPYQFHYRYHYRHYRPGHFSRGRSSGSSGGSSGSSSSSYSTNLEELGGIEIGGRITTIEERRKGREGFMS
ncbi:hypothetical protein QR685DRAFT_594765 [Neurospora intermedia]|uniref:Uncharacterized protein n=1 Tax=Neurospora intermedia TaxID=5142 RepID=A0ABR3DJV5_NEUIN